MKYEEVYQKIDGNIRHNKAKLIAYARTRRDKNCNKYEYFSQFVVCEYKNRTAESIRKEILDATGINSVTGQQIWNIKSKFEGSIETLKPIKKGEKYCRRCKKREIPPENKLFCTHCMLNNYRIASQHEEHRGIGNITKHAGSY